MKRIAVVAYGMGNVDSVVRGLEEVGAAPELTADPDDLRTCQGIVLPGVGAFAAGMEALGHEGLDELLREQAAEGVPLLGICLGMHLLAAMGTEGGDVAGLGLIDGKVVRLVPPAPGVTVPHVGWNEVQPRIAHPILTDIAPGSDFYFVHSYHFDALNDEQVVATTPYCGNVVSVVARDNVVGVQFHPEKSQRRGLQMLRNFVDLLC